MIRSSIFIQSCLLLGLSFNLYSAEETLIEKELLKDGIVLAPVANLQDSNPLKNLIRPKKTPQAVEYEYHAWSEADALGNYPIYVWEVAEGAATQKLFELASYNVGVFEPKNFFSDLKIEEREALTLKIYNKSLLGGLTKRSLSEVADTQKFKLIVAKVEVTKITNPPLNPIVKPAPPKNQPIVTNQAPVMRADKSKELVGVPVEGRPGFIYSPSADGVINKSMLIDVTGLAPSTRVKDPYTGKIILVP